jgi:hypothetical protein
VAEVLKGQSKQAALSLERARRTTGRKPRKEALPRQIEAGLQDLRKGLEKTAGLIKGKYFAQV